MHRFVVPLILAAAAVAAAPSRADACTMVFLDYFTRFDAAPIVASVEVTEVESEHSGPVAMRGVETLKGAATATLRGEHGGMCPPHFVAGQTGVAFFDANGVATWIEPTSAAGPLAKWKAAKTDKARRKLLVKLARGKDQMTKLHAKHKLGLLDEAAKAAKAAEAAKAAR